MFAFRTTISRLFMPHHEALPMKKVVTLNNEGFISACKCLEAEILSSGFLPDVVVGIESGGRYVADEIFLEQTHCYIAKHRPGSKSKKNILSGIIGRLPVPVADMLRIIESYMLSIRKLKNTHAFETDIPSNIRDSSKILVVDDAIDTGNTMLSVVMSLKNTNPSAEIRTAVIVRTLTSSRHKPDYCLYNNILIRFPWSIDAVRLRK